MCYLGGNRDGYMYPVLIRGVGGCFGGAIWGVWRRVGHTAGGFVRMREDFGVRCLLLLVVVAVVVGVSPGK